VQPGAQLDHRVVGQVQEVGRAAGIAVHLGKQLLAPLAMPPPMVGMTMSRDRK
jgi:hypothetical protein